MSLTAPYQGLWEHQCLHRLVPLVFIIVGSWIGPADGFNCCDRWFQLGQRSRCSLRCKDISLANADIAQSCSLILARKFVVSTCALLCPRRQAGGGEANLSYEPEEIPGRSLAQDEPTVATFEDWADRRGLRKVNLVHADFGGLRGLMTEGAVEPWQTLISVPLSHALVEDACQSEKPAMPPKPLSEEVWQSCPWWVRLAVRLLIERGDNSRLAPYVGILPPPASMGTLLHWSPEQMDRLHYPYLLDQVSKQRQLFKRMRERLLTDATRPNSGADDTPAGRVLVTALHDPEAFFWALECVQSRAFQLPPKGVGPHFPSGDEYGDGAGMAPAVEPPSPEEARMALLPLIDSMNHYSRVPTHMHWQGDGSVAVSVGSHFDPGDHTFLSYGSISNDDLLQYYGFVERDNPADSYVLQHMAEWLIKEGWLNQSLQSRLIACPKARETWRYLERGVLLRDGVHPTTMQALRMVCCEPGAPRTVANRARNEASKGSSDNPLDLAVCATEGNVSEMPPPWDGSSEDLSRFTTPVSLVSEMSAWELVMHLAAEEADAWGEAGVARALVKDVSAPGLDGDLDGVGLDDERRLMLSVFRQEKLLLLRRVLSRLGHLRKVSGMLNRPVKVPVVKVPPVLGSSRVLPD